MKAKKIKPLGKHPRLHEFLAHYIAHAGLTNREIAAACGIRVVNMVSMICTGHARLPLERLGPPAKVLGIDPFDLFRRWMSEYYGETRKELAPLIRRAS